MNLVFPPTSDTAASPNLFILRTRTCDKLNESCRPFRVGQWAMGHVAIRADDGSLLVTDTWKNHRQIHFRPSEGYKLCICAIHWNCSLSARHFLCFVVVFVFPPPPRCVCLVRRGCWNRNEIKWNYGKSIVSLDRWLSFSPYGIFSRWYEYDTQLIEDKVEL